MKKIGGLLKNEREKKSLSLHEIGMALKINPKILKAIEEADTKNLPAKTFLRGFIRSYAQYLRMDVNQIMEVFQEEVGSTRPEEPKSPIAPIEPNPAPGPAKSEKAALPKTGELLSGQKVYMLIGSFILILMIVFVARMVDKYQKESRRGEIETSSPIAIEEKESLDKAVDVSTPLSNADSSPPPMTPISGESTTQKLSPVTTPEPTPVAVQTPAPTPTAKPSPVATATPAPTPSVSPTPAASPVATKATEVIVEALNKVEIKYSFGDEKWETLSLSADQLHTFKSKTGVYLEINDGGAINLIVNGRDRGVPGSIGKPIKLSYPK
jgi:cytoskeleton protein RodZ